MQGISIIVPTRNEADNIDPLLQRVFAVEFLKSIDHEVIFVDDSSSDSTRDNVRQWCDGMPVYLIERDGGGGLASAVVAGAHQARYDTCLVMDADLSHPPEKIPEIVSPLLSGDCDMVIGSRYVEGGATPEWPLARRIASRLATIPAHIFTDANDPMAGFFGTTTGRLKALRSDVPGFKIGLEVLALGGDDLRVREVPIIFNDRFEGFSKMNKRIIFEYLEQVVQLSRFRTELFTPRYILLLMVLGTLCDSAVFAAVKWSAGPMLTAHLAGIGAGASLLALIMGRGQKRYAEDRLSRVGRIAGFVIFLIYAAALQGGVFVLLGSAGFLPEIGAFIPAAAAACGSFVLASALFVNSGYGGLPKRVQAKLAALSVIAALVLLRLLYLGLPELMEQEAYYWNYAQHPSLSYLDHPPLSALLIGIGSILFGTTEFAVRVGAFFCWFVTAFYSYRLSYEIFGRTAAWGSVLLVSILPLYFGSGFILTPDSPLHAAWAAFIYYLYRSLVQGHANAWFGVGVSLGLGMLSKYTIVLLGPGIVLFMLIDGRARKWIVRPQPYGAVLLALFLFAPVLIWNYQHEWSSFLFQGGQRIAAQDFFTTHRLIAYIIVLLTPAGALSAGWFMIRGNSFIRKYGMQAREGSRFVFSREFCFLLLLVLSPLVVFFVFSLDREVKMNWTSPVWLATLPYLGCLVMAIPGETSIFQRFLKWLWKYTVGVLVIAYCLFLHYSVLGLPGVPYISNLFLLGWEEFAEEVETVVRRVEKNTGKRPVVVGMDPYQISSGLAFYRAKIHRHDPGKRAQVVDDMLGWHLFTWDGLMYEYWADPSDYYGRDVLAVASSRIRVEYLYFQERFLKLGEIKTIDVTKDGQLIHRYHYRIVRKYQEVRKKQN